jgi:hypothetical protein
MEQKIWASIVKGNAKYTCIECGSTENIQAHDPTHKHVDPRDGQCLCAEHHADKHPNMPKALFLSIKNHQPYWENKSASTLASELNVHPRTIRRIANRLGIGKGFLSNRDEGKIKKTTNIRSNAPTILKCFRIPNDLLFVLQNEAKKRGITESRYVNTLLRRICSKKEEPLNKMNRIIYREWQEYLNNYFFKYGKNQNM